MYALHNSGQIKAVLQRAYKHMTVSSCDPHERVRFHMDECALWLYLGSVAHNYSNVHTHTHTQIMDNSNYIYATSGALCLI